MTRPAHTRAPHPQIWSGLFIDARAAGESAGKKWVLSRERARRRAHRTCAQPHPCIRVCTACVQPTPRCLQRRSKPPTVLRRFEVGTPYPRPGRPGRALRDFWGLARPAVRREPPWAGGSATAAYCPPAAADGNRRPCTHPVLTRPVPPYADLLPTPCNTAMRPGRGAGAAARAAVVVVVLVALAPPAAHGAQPAPSRGPQLPEPLRRLAQAAPPNVKHAPCDKSKEHTCAGEAQGSRDICCNKNNFVCGIVPATGDPRCATCPQYCIFTCDPALSVCKASGCGRGPNAQLNARVRQGDPPLPRCPAAERSGGWVLQMLGQGWRRRHRTAACPQRQRRPSRGMAAATSSWPTAATSSRPPAATSSKPPAAASSSPATASASARMWPRAGVFRPQAVQCRALPGQSLHANSVPARSNLRCYPLVYSQVC